MTQTFFLLGCLVAGTGVIAGAFGAHSLASVVSEEMLETFGVGVRYQMFHGLALLAVAWAASKWPGTGVHVAGWLFVAGTVLFSGSIYVLVLSGQKWLGMVTPIGGVALIAGWFTLAWHVVSSS